MSQIDYESNELSATLDECDPGPDEAELAAARACCPICGSCDHCDCSPPCPPKDHCPICGKCPPCDCCPARGISFADVMQAINDINKASR